jgi:hypothetical protein
MRWLTSWPRPPPIPWPRLPAARIGDQPFGEAREFPQFPPIDERRTLKQSRKASRTTRLTVTGAATAAAIIWSPVAATPAEAATRLGGVDMQRACTTQYPSGWGLTAHVNNPDNAYSWSCWSPWDRTSYGIDVKRACVNQYGAGAYPGLGHQAYPKSWYCQR